MNNQTIRRGDVYWASPPGFEKHRFVVVQNNQFNTYFDEILLVPVISQKREETNDWEVKVSKGTFPKPSIINCSYILTLKCSELGDFICSLDNRTMQGVDYSLSVALGLQDW